MATKGDQFLAQSIIPGIPSQTIVFIGIQPLYEDHEGGESVALYNITQDVPDHPKHSTLSRWTLEDMGYVLPKEAP